MRLSKITSAGMRMSLRCLMMTKMVRELSQFSGVKIIKLRVVAVVVRKLLMSTITEILGVSLVRGTR